MGRFCAIILFAAACGDNLTPVGGAHDPGGTTDTNGNITPEPLTVPAVCGNGQWTSVYANHSVVMDLSAAANRSTGATLLSTPRAGGAIMGFTVNDRMTITGDPNGTKVPINDAFTSVSVSMVAERIVSTAVDATSIQVDLLDQDLGNPVTVAKLDGNVIAKTAMFQTGGSMVVPYASAGGLSLATFDTGWQKTGDEVVAPTGEPITGLAATQHGDAVLTAFTTAHTCSIDLLTTGKPGESSTLGFGCGAPRIAANYLGGTATVVFEAAGGVLMSNVVHGEMVGDTSVIQPVARAPRVVFDGSRYWVSYLNDHNDVIVGYIDGNNHLVSTSLNGPKPANDAYELTMIDHNPWVFTLDVNGYEAHKMCLDAVW